MLGIFIHGVKRIELATAFPSNGSCRTVRIVGEDCHGNAYTNEITVYGQTEDLDALPRAKDFRLYDEAGHPVALSEAA